MDRYQARTRGRGQVVSLSGKVECSSSVTADLVVVEGKVASSNGGVYQVALRFSASAALAGPLGELVVESGSCTCPHSQSRDVTDRGVCGWCKHLEGSLIRAVEDLAVDSAADRSRAARMMEARMPC